MSKTTSVAIIATLFVTILIVLASNWQMDQYSGQVQDVTLKSGGKVRLVTNRDYANNPQCTWQGMPACTPTPTPVTPTNTPVDWAQRTETMVANQNMVSVAMMRANATQTAESAKLFPSATPSPKPTNTPVPTLFPAVKTAIAAQTLSALGALSTKPSPTANATTDLIVGQKVATATINAVDQALATPEPGSVEGNLHDASTFVKKNSGSMGSLGTLLIILLIVVLFLYIILGKGGHKAIGGISQASTDMMKNEIGKYIFAIIILIGGALVIITIVSGQ